MFNLAHDDLYEVSLIQKFLNQVCINVLHYSARSEAAWVDPHTSQDLLTAIATAWDTNMAPNLSDGLTLDQLTIRSVVGWMGTVEVPRPLYFALDTLVPVGIAGTVAGAALPSYAAVTARKRTGFAGRKYNGSLRQAGIVEADSTGNLLTGGAAAAFQTAINDTFLADLALGVNDQIEVGVFSLSDMVFNNIIPGPVPVASVYWAKVTSMPINEYLGSQVSRKFGHGF